MPFASAFTPSSLLFSSSQARFLAAYSFLFAIVIIVFAVHIKQILFTLITTFFVVLLLFDSDIKQNLLLLYDKIRGGCYIIVQLPCPIRQVSSLCPLYKGYLLLLV